MINTKKYIEEFLKIRTKEGEIKKITFKPAQQVLYDEIKSQYTAGKPCRIIVLKARQLGISTMTGAVYFKKTATDFNVRTAIVAHKDDATKNLFGMYKMYYENLPEIIRPEIQASNAFELAFDNKTGTGLKSNIRCFTAGGQGIGRSMTIDNLHLSEFAFWPGDKRGTLNGLLQAVPNTVDSCIIIESTANGFEQFKTLWDDAVDGKNDFKPLFFGWWFDPSYSMPAEESFQPVPAGRYGDEMELIELYDLTFDQLKWRRWCIDNNCQGDLRLFKQEYPSNPEEAFLSTGYSAFENELVISQLERAKKLEPKRGTFTYSKKYLDKDHCEIDVESIKFREDKRGSILIYEEPVNKKDEEGVVTALAPYVLGGDTSGGEETIEKDKDYFTMQVTNNITGRVAAVFRQQTIDEDLYADQAYCLGMYYHKALIGIETNFSVQPTRELEKLAYPNLYMRERLDTVKNAMVHAIGFETNVKTRPVMIAELVQLFRTDPTIVPDVDTLKEMLTFIKINRKYQAAEGYHDDLVMALAISRFISTQQTATWIEIKRTEGKGFLERNFKINTRKKGGYIQW